MTRFHFPPPDPLAQQRRGGGVASAVLAYREIKRTPDSYEATSTFGVLHDGGWEWTVRVWRPARRWWRRPTHTERGVEPTLPRAWATADAVMRWHTGGGA